MRVLRLLAALGLTLSLAQCRSPYERTPLSKGVLLDVVVSNSVMHVESPVPTKVGAQVLVDYSFLLQNVGNQQVAFLLSQTTAHTDDQPLVTTCAVQDQVRKELVVRPGGRHRIDCVIELSVEVKRKLTHSDAQITLMVPLTHASGEGGFEFEYRLYKGDAG